EDGIRDLHVTGVQMCALPISLLLAVVADVDPGLDLLGHDPGERLAPRGLDLGRVHRLALGAPRIEPHQLRRPRQAPGMGGQNPLLAPAHGFASLSRLTLTRRAAARLWYARRAPTRGPASPAARRFGRPARDTRRHRSSAGAF